MTPDADTLAQILLAAVIAAIATPAVRVVIGAFFALLGEEG